MYQKWKDSKRHEKIKVSVHLKESSLRIFTQSLHSESSLRILQLELYQGQMEKRKLNLGSRVALLDLCQVLKDNYCHVFFDNFLIVLPWFKSSTIMDWTSVQLVPIKLTCRRWKRATKWSEEITSTPKLRDPTQYLHHIYHISWRQDDNVWHAPIQEKRTEHF